VSTTRAAGLIGFVVCAGITGVWGLVSPDRLYTFFLAGGVVCFVAFKLGNAPRHDDEHDPEATRQLYNIAYSQGVQHGIEQARVAPGSGGAHRTHARKGSSGGLPRVG
jgi:hypothetical protein